ncbi:hypothetical protein HOY80DRAFT_954631, partial [Tuber brumale]
MWGSLLFVGIRVISCCWNAVLELGPDVAFRHNTSLLSCVILHSYDFFMFAFLESVSHSSFFLSSLSLSLHFFFGVWNWIL